MGHSDHAEGAAFGGVAGVEADVELIAVLRVGGDEWEVAVLIVNLDHASRRVVSSYVAPPFG